MRGQGMELTVLLRLTQTHSEPFRGMREEAPPLTQSPPPRPAHAVLPQSPRLIGSLSGQRKESGKTKNV